MKKDFETEVLTRLAVIESKIDDYKELKSKTDSAFSLSKENKERITTLEENQSKLTWAIIIQIIGVAGAIAIFLFQKAL